MSYANVSYKSQLVTLKTSVGLEPTAYVKQVSFDLPSNQCSYKRVNLAASESSSGQELGERSWVL